MFSEQWIESTASEFIVNTCRIHPQPNVCRFEGLVRLFDATSDQHGKDVTHMTYQTLTGSVSEFNIEPMLPSVGDIDIMAYTSSVLLVRQGHPLIRSVQLPVEFHTSDNIKLTEFIDSEFPGYVYIRYIGQLIKSIGHDSNKYRFEPVPQPHDLGTRTPYEGDARHGPANLVKDASVRTRTIDERCYTTALSMDFVQCYRCLQWPLQAAEWPTRIRQHGYPDAATVQLAVNDGCDLVFTTHRQCKRNEWYGKRMHRISFSRAETILLNSWTPRRQMAYHVLRYVIKTAALLDMDTDDASQPTGQSGSGLFSNYHLKTLMLWSCELHSEQWWEMSLVRITTALLHDLADLLQSGICQQYFITPCNLLDHLQDVDSDDINSVVSWLRSITTEKLSVWLVDHYVRDCANWSSHHISPFMNDINTPLKLQYALSSIVNWRIGDSFRKSMEDFGYIFIVGEKLINRTRAKHFHVYRQFIKAMREVDERFVDFFTALIFLHLTELMRRGLHNFEIVEVINDLMQHNKSSTSLQTKSQSNSKETLFTKATKILLKLKIEVNTDTMLLVELAKAFFHMSIDSIDVHPKHHDCLAHSYLASLYYSTKQYRTAIDQLLLVSKSSHTECCSHVIETQLFPDNGEVIHVVSGIIALHQFIVQTTRVSSQETRPMADMKLYSFSRIVKCLGHIKNTIAPFASRIMRCYGEQVRNSKNISIADVLLVHFAALRKVQLYSTRTIRDPTHSPSGPIVFNTSRLNCLLMKSAVERLTTVRHNISRDYGALLNNVTSDYEAMYAFKCGEYEQCASLCQRNVDRLLEASGLIRSFSLPSSDLLMLLDDLSLCLIGLCVLGSVYDDEDEVKTQQENITQLSLSIYLLVQCKLKMSQLHSPVSKVLSTIMKVHHRTPVHWITDHLMLTIAYRKARQMLARRHWQ